MGQGAMEGSDFDVVIVGGGVMGCSTAYHLLLTAPELRVAVVEKDPSYRQASSALSVGNARIQFSLEQNIEISRYTFEIVERFVEEMEVEGESPNIAFKPEGNLFLVDEGSELEARASLERQQAAGCPVEWWSASQIGEHFSILEAESYVGGTFGPRDGHLDGYAFLMGYRRKAHSLGASMVTGRVQSVSTDSQGVKGVVVSEGPILRAPVVVNCAGAWASELLASMGIELPVVPVQRQVFVVEPEIKPSAALPLVLLPSGLYFRSEGLDRILVGRSMEADRVGFDLRWQESRFTELLWPELVEIVPVFDRLRFERGWAGLYAVNTLDGGAILGEWPEMKGLYLANGFSGHGLQQAPAVGRYLAELIVGRSPVLDLSLFSPERILTGRAIRETALA